MITHMTGGTDPTTCPRTGEDRCDCKRKGRLEIEYGCCCYGVGSFRSCNRCGKVWNFYADME